MCRNLLRHHQPVPVLVDYGPMAGRRIHQVGVGANSNGGEAVIRIKFCYYPYYIPRRWRGWARVVVGRGLPSTDRVSGIVF